MRGILLIDDRNQTADELRSWLGAGVEATVAASWSEAVDTLSYKLLAGSELPAVLLGPLGKPGIDAVQQLRSQGASPGVALYTESRAVDQDPALVRQFQLLAIIHKPFSDAQRELLLRQLATAAASSNAPASGAPPPERARIGDDGPRPGKSTEASLPDLPGGGFDDLGGGRSSSVREPAAPKPRSKVVEEVPSGVQRLLQESGHQAAGPREPKVKEDEALVRLAEPRAIAILAIDDKYSTGSLLLERLGKHGQRVSVAPSYAEASRFLEQLGGSSTGCELMIGPLSADGTAMVRECRRRNLPTHAVFYTESQSQSQDPRLPAQYGCLAIVRRDGLIEQLDSLILELRSFRRRAPAVPQERPKTAPPAAGGKPATTRSGEIPVSTGAGRTGATARPSGIHVPPPPPAAPATGRVTQGGSTTRVAPPEAAPAQRPPPAVSTAATDTSLRPSRIRRSLQLPAQPPAAAGTAPMEIPGEGPSGPPRVLVCTACAQEFVAAASPGVPVRCPHCQALNKV